MNTNVDNRYRSLVLINPKRNFQLITNETK